MGDLALRSVPVRFAGVEAALQQARVGGARVWQAQGLPEAGRAAHAAIAEGVAARGVEHPSDERERAGDGSGRQARRCQGVYAEGSVSIKRGGPLARPSSTTQLNRQQAKTGLHS